MEEIIFTKISSFKIEREKNKIIGLVERNSEYDFESLEISLHEKSIYFENIDDNLLIQLNGEPKKKIEKKHITKDERIIQGKIFIKKDSILVKEAYLNRESIPEKLKFKMSLRLNKNQIKEETFEKEIQLVKQKAIPKISIIKDKRFFEKVTYEKNKFEFGYVVIKNVGKQYSYDLEVKDLKFKLINSNGDYILSEALYLKPQNEDGDEVIKIKPGKEKRFQLELDISILNNPDKKETYTIEISGKKKLKDKDTFMPIDPNLDFSLNDSCSFEIEENTTETDLIVSIELENEGKNREITNNTEIVNLGSRNYELDKTKETKSIVQGYFGNRATDGTKNTDYIEIKDIKIEYSITPKDNKHDNEEFKSKIRNIIKIDFLKFDFTQNNWKKFSPNKSPILLHNKSNSFVKFKVHYKHSDFRPLGDEMNSMDINATLSFSYDIKDENGRSKIASLLGEVKAKTYKFNFIIRQHEGLEWLAIDFGTSAISAQYGSQESNILDNGLKTQLKNLVGAGFIETNYYETDEFILSSTIALKNADPVNEKRFHNSFISLSPEKGKISNNEELLLPYLKALVGYDKLPKFLLELTNNKKFQKIIKEKDVQSIINETYHILLEDFVYPLFKTRRKNKIVLTIPNTFTSRHTNMLKDIVKVVNPAIWDDYTLFLSESDAVAWYYLNNEDLLLSKTEIEKRLLNKRKKIFKEKGQNVLVYDMGAGTLDITLFRIEYDKINNKKIISILGRSGQTTAGNYTDYVLANEFWKQVEKPVEGKLQGYHPVSNSYIGNSEWAFDYNLFIRNKLKPNLGNTDSIENEEIITGHRFPNLIDSDNITKSASYRELLEKNSVQILEFLKSTFAIDKDFKIDTIVLSGRGIQLYGLEQALLEALKNVFNSEQPLTIRFAPNELKSIVSKGAIYYACKKDRPDIVYKPLPLDARYGIITYHTGGNRQYNELLNPQSEFMENIEFDDNSISGYEATKKWENLFNVDKLDIVQTYLCEKDVQNALVNDNDKFYDSSSIVKSININADNVDSSHYLHIVVDKDGEVHIKFDYDKTPPKVITIDENIFEKTMYYLFKSQDNGN